MSEDWKSELPEGIREWDEVKNSDSPDKFWQQIENQRKLLGQSLRIPSSEAGDEDWNQFYEKVQAKAPGLMRTPNTDDPETVASVLKTLGMPEDASEYAVPDGEGISFRDNQVEFLRNAAKEAGLTKAQFQKLAEVVGKDNANAMTASEARQQEQLEALKSEWGLTFEERYEKAKNFAKLANAPEALIDSLDKKMLDAKTVTWLYSLSDSIGESSQVSKQPDGSGESGSSLTPHEAEQRIQEIYNNPNHPFHRGDLNAQKRMVELVRMAESAA